MRRPARQARRLPKTMARTVLAPTGGWNTRDSLDSMPINDAVVMDNWFPSVGKVEVRKGYTEFCTGLGAAVETLAEYQAGATSKLLGFANGNIWDVTSGTASSVDSGFSNDRWDTANFSGKIFMVNGADAPQDWDGTTLTATSWSGTGLTISNLVGINVFKNRLFFWENNSQNFWYAALNAVTGTLTEFPLSRVSTLGGNLIEMGTWTRDGGNGVDDYAVFVMDTGEVIVYQGTDPGDAAAWSLVGVYRIGIPLGTRCLVKVGGDLMIMTTDDYVSLSQVLQTGQIGQGSKLSGAVREAAQSNASGFGWQAQLYRQGNMLIFNVPNTDGTFDQHIINTITGAPCRFRDIPANCWGLFGGDCYFGGDGVVYKFDDGYFDDEADVEASVSQAWNDFEIPYRKRLAAIRALVESESDLEYEIRTRWDFLYKESITKGYIYTAASYWDEAEWDVDYWASEFGADIYWKSFSGTGYTLLTQINTTSAQRVSWFRTDYRLEIGQNL